MILGQGLDLVYLEDFSELFQDPASCFEEAHFSAEERRWARESPSGDPIRHLCARYAAKEAAMKCLGTGWADGTAFREIEVRRNAQGAPELSLHGPTAARAAALGIRRWHVSLTHTDATATAFVIAES